MSQQTTHMMLIVPSEYKKIWKEKHADSKIPKREIAWPTYGAAMKARGEMLVLKFAEIRKTSGRVGEVRHRHLDDIGSITLTEDFTTQKRWYKAMIAYNEKGKKAGRPSVEFLYFFIDPWIMGRLLRSAEKNKEENHSASQC